jgi:uncharacterized integral membrane protein
LRDEEWCRETGACWQLRTVSDTTEKQVIIVHAWFAELVLYDMIYLTAIGLTSSGTSTPHIYTQTIHRTTQLTTLVGRLSELAEKKKQANWKMYT